MDDLGVVDPLRLPQPVIRLARDTPRLVWVFVAATLIAVGRDLVGPGGLRLPVDLTGALALIARSLVILLPAAALMHRPTVRTEAPWVFWGLSLAAAGRLLLGPPGALGADVTPTDVGLSFANVGASLVPLLGLLVEACGWVIVAWGFVRRAHASVSIAGSGVAWLASAIVVGAAIVDLVTTTRLLANGVYSPVGVPLLELAARLAITLASATLVWVFVRQAASSRSVATIAAASWAILTACGAALVIATSGWFGLAPAEALSSIYGWTVLAFDVIPPVLLLVALAAGIVDMATDPRRGAART